jgi:S-DNA-T family DNA segregation ATPase FtsK/SpoIIIE
MPKTSAPTRTRRARAPQAEEPRRARSQESAAPARTGGRPPERLIADLSAIALCLLGGLLTLALLRPGSAGMVGSFLFEFIRLWMGSVVHVAPLLFFGAGITLALDHRRATSSQMLFGIAGMLIVLFGCVHLAATPRGEEFTSTTARFFALLPGHADTAPVKAPDGGLFGALIMGALYPLGKSGSYLTLGAVGIASLLLLSELTLRGIMERAHERSRIAAEKAKKAAAAHKERQLERQLDRNMQQSALPAPRKKGLFLDLDPEPEETPSPVRRTEPAPERQPAAEKPVRRGLFSRRAKDEVPEEEETAVPAPAPEVAREKSAARVAREAGVDETALVPVDEPVPAVVENRMPPITRGGKPSRPGRAARAPITGEGYVMPPLDLLETPVPRPKRVAQDTEANIAILVNTLAQFRIQAEVVEIADGPSVTRYEIRLGEGIRVKKILDLADNIAMSLSAMSVRVEAPIPGKAAIGIEVPKKHASKVTLRECMEDDEARDLTSKVGFVLGKDVAGNVRCADLARMPHLLVAGATNSGKSVCLNVLIASMLFRARPDELKMIMIDPKRVELTLFDGIPHLIHPVVKDVKQAAGILRWVLKEMDRRYDLFAHVMTRNIEGYNIKVANEPEKRMPFLVVVIDELADLMMQQGPEIEQAICRLAQLARATGIHLVIATQRPSVDVITGLIKANVPSRIAFSVSSQIDSRTILDIKGAENLIGRGDMLFKPIDATKPIRIQGAFLSEAEVEALTNHLKAQGRPEYIAESLAVDHGNYGTASEEEVEDDMFEPAARFVVTTGHASTSMIQRKFKIGYTRAARLVDMMEARGIVGALDGAKPREIMMSRDSLDQMFQNTRNSLYGGSGYAGDEEEDEDDGEVLVLEETLRPSDEDPFTD